MQIDHVFASRGFHENVQVKALNKVEEWGLSDHCRIRIEVGHGNGQGGGSGVWPSPPKPSGGSVGLVGCDTRNEAAAQVGRYWE